MSMKKVISKFLFILAAFTVVFAISGTAQPVAADEELQMEYGSLREWTWNEGDIAYIRLMNEDDSATFIYRRDASYSHGEQKYKINKSVSGVSYSSKTNTLTLKNYTGHILNIVEMGTNFKIKLVGENTLDAITIHTFNPYYWEFPTTIIGCNVTFTGSGTLTINGTNFSGFGDHVDLYGQHLDEGEGYLAGIYVDANETPAKIKFSKKVTVTINAPKGGNAIYIYRTTSSKAFTYASTLKKSGGKISKSKSYSYVIASPGYLGLYNALYKTSELNEEDITLSDRYYIADKENLMFILAEDAFINSDGGYGVSLEELKDLAEYYEDYTTFKPENGGFEYAMGDAIYTYRSTKNKAVKIRVK